MKGGKRPNAGRKAGGKNRLTVGKEQAIEAMAEELGLVEPLVLLMAVLNDASVPIDVRIECAKAALPYRHKRQPQEHVVDQYVHLPPPLVLICGTLGDEEDPDGGSTDPDQKFN